MTNRVVGDGFDERATYFITVDLDIFSRRRLGLLVHALGDHVVVLHEGRWGSRYSANLELGASWNLSADQEVRSLARLIRDLPDAAKHLWDGAESRVFNIGVQAGIRPPSHELKLSSATVSLLAQLKAAVIITTYAARVPAPRSSSGKHRGRPTTR